MVESIENFYDFKRTAYENKRMQKEHVIELLRERGFRITRQRLLILDIVLDADCSCCKEICYKAAIKKANIGVSTVYRMVNVLEEIGAISKKNSYTVSCPTKGMDGEACRVLMDDDTRLHLTEANLKAIINAGLEALGYKDSKNSIKQIELSA